MEQPIEKTSDSKTKQWLKRIGIFGFLFFLIKGLAWIAVFIFVKQCSGY